MTEPAHRHPPAEIGQVVGSVKLNGLAVTGYALDPGREDLGLVVELIADGMPLAIARADLFEPSLAAGGTENPFHGFAFRLPQAVIDAASVVEVRLANGGPPVGAPLRLQPEELAPAPATGPGFLAWLGGLRFGGWTTAMHDGEARLMGLIDEDLVVEAQSSGWTTVTAQGGDLAVPSFEFHLPPRFADGRAHALEVVTADGDVLPPGRVSFVAFEDGLRAFMAGQSDVASEQVRGALFDRLIPQSLPFSALDDWRRRFPTVPPPEAAGGSPVAVALIGDEGLDASLDSLQDQAVNWTAGVLQVRPGTAIFPAEDLLAFLEGEGASCDAVVFAASGTVFLDHALATLAVALREHEGALCAYADTIGQGPDGQPLPLGLPAYDAERMIEQGYAAGCFGLTRAAALRAARLGADSLFRLFNSSVEALEEPTAVPLHVPGFLAIVPPLDTRAATEALALAGRHHCGVNRIEAEIEPNDGAFGLASVRLRRRAAPCIISIVILVRNGVDQLRRCLAAVGEQASVHNLDIVIVDNDSSAPEALALLDRLAREGLRVVRVEGAGNGARLRNRGAEAARGELVCFLDAGLVLATPDAIDEMAGRLADPEVAAVGCVVTWPSGVVRDGGLVSTFRDGATAALAGHAPGDPGYAGLLGVAREVSALSGDVMMVRRRQFLASGGMDEIVFPLVFPAASFCLRMREAGHRVVLTPHARAVWTGPVHELARGPEAAQRMERELAALRQRWPEAIDNDRFYSPLLALNGPLHAALAWPPGDTRPRWPDRIPPIGPVPAARRTSPIEEG